MPSLTLDDFELPLQARIFSNDKILPGYCASMKKDPYGTTIECWIAVEEGAPFEVQWLGASRTRKERSLAIQADLWLGNEQMDGVIVLPEEREGGVCGHVAEQPVETGGARPFVFKKAALTGDNDVASKDGYNTIKIQLTWGTATEPSKLTEFDDAQDQLDAPIHEKTSKKGDGSAPGLGDVKPWPVLRQFILVPEPGMPSITYVFRCASREWLQAEGIIPPPSPKVESPSPRSRSPSRGITEERMGSLLSELVVENLIEPKPEPSLQATTSHFLPKSGSPPPKAGSLSLKLDPDLPTKTSKRSRGKARERNVIDLTTDIKSEPDSDDMVWSGPKSKKKRRKVKMDEDVKPNIKKSIKPKHKRA